MEKIYIESIPTPEDLEAQETASLDRSDTKRLLGFVTAKLEALRVDADKDDIDLLAEELEQVTSSEADTGAEYGLAA